MEEKSTFNESYKDNLLLVFQFRNKMYVDGIVIKLGLISTEVFERQRETITA